MRCVNLQGTILFFHSNVMLFINNSNKYTKIISNSKQTGNQNQQIQTKALFYSLLQKVGCPVTGQPTSYNFLQILFYLIIPNSLKHFVSFSTA